MTISNNKNILRDSVRLEIECDSPQDILLLKTYLQESASLWRKLGKAERKRGQASMDLHAADMLTALAASCRKAYTLRREALMGVSEQARSF